ncbi:hypothetical protein NO373_00500 [Escherichia coli]|nr:hypothetical protein [Escherichia coli]
MTPFWIWLASPLASPEASLHIGEVSRLINMSREIAQHCQQTIAVERSHH